MSYSQLTVSDAKTVRHSQIENIDYHTDFSIEKATRKDSGIYTLKAENRNGKDEAQCELVVLGTYWTEMSHDVSSSSLSFRLCIKRQKYD